jgi:hypothetical protein
VNARTGIYNAKRTRKIYFYDATATRDPLLQRPCALARCSNLVRVLVRGRFQASLVTSGRGLPRQKNFETWPFHPQPPSRSTPRPRPPTPTTHIPATDRRYELPAIRQYLRPDDTNPFLRPHLRCIQLTNLTIHPAAHKHHHHNKSARRAQGVKGKNATIGRSGGGIEKWPANERATHIANSSSQSHKYTILDLVTPNNQYLRLVTVLPL